MDSVGDSDEEFFSSEGVHREVLQGDFRNVRRRIESGESVNKKETQRNFSLLHMAVLKNRTEILEYLLARKGIEVDARCSEGKTPLFLATSLGHMESVEKLIRAGADVNICDSNYFPLHMSMRRPDICHLLIRHGARIDAINRNGGTLLHQVVDPMSLEVVHMTDLLDFFDYIDSVPSFLEVIVESDNFEYAVEFFCNDTCYASFVNNFGAYRLDLEQLTALTCRLLQYGFRATSREIHMIFSHYGYCELFRILLYMDNNFTCHWHHGMVVSRLIFDVDYNLESDAREISYIPKKNVMRLLEYSICPRLIDALTVEYSDDEQMSTILSKLPRVPSLIELTRNAARKHIWHKLKFTNACQLYTTIDHLDMPTVYKNILTFRKKIYEVEQ